MALETSAKTAYNVNDLFVAIGEFVHSNLNVFLNPILRFTSFHPFISLLLQPASCPSSSSLRQMLNLQLSQGLVLLLYDCSSVMFSLTFDLQSAAKNNKAGCC